MPARALSRFANGRKLARSGSVLSWITEGSSHAGYSLAAVIAAVTTAARVAMVGRVGTVKRLFMGGFLMNQWQHDGSSFGSVGGGAFVGSVP